jgi:hypothetical protein
MIRLHPIPLRYLEPDKRFKNFQWIEVDVKKDTHDPRPESYRVNAETIELGDVIPTRDYEERRKWLERSPHFCRSVEELQERQKEAETSLGILVPRRITRIYTRRKPDSARAEWEVQEDRVRNQQLLPFPGFDKPMRIEYIASEFRVKWECDDEACGGHDMGLLKWDLHEMWRREAKGDMIAADRKAEEAMKARLNEERRDVFLILGNHRKAWSSFMLVDTYEAPVKTQMSLF